MVGVLGVVALIVIIFLVTRKNTSTSTHRNNTPTPSPSPTPSHHGSHTPTPSPSPTPSHHGSHTPTPSPKGICDYTNHDNNCANNSCECPAGSTCNKDSSSKNAGKCMCDTNNCENCVCKQSGYSCNDSNVCTQAPIVLKDLDGKLLKLDPAVYAHTNGESHDDKDQENPGAMIGCWNLDSLKEKTGWDRFKYWNGSCALGEITVPDNIEVVAYKGSGNWNNLCGGGGSDPKCLPSGTSNIGADYCALKFREITTDTPRLCP